MYVWIQKSSRTLKSLILSSSGLCLWPSKAQVSGICVAQKSSLVFLSPRPKGLTSNEWVTYGTFPEWPACAEDRGWSNSEDEGLQTLAPAHLVWHLKFEGACRGVVSLTHATVLPRDTIQTGIRPRSFSSVYGHLSMWITILAFLFHSYTYIQYSICLLWKNNWLSGLGVHSSLPSRLSVTFLPAPPHDLLRSQRSILDGICPSFWAYRTQQHRKSVVAGWTES